MKLSFGKMTLERNIFHIIKQHREGDKCYQTQMNEALTMKEAPTATDFDQLNSFFLISKILASFDNEKYANIYVVFAKFQNYGTSPW